MAHSVRKIYLVRPKKLRKCAKIPATLTTRKVGKNIFKVACEIFDFVSQTAKAATLTTKKVGINIFLVID